MFYHILTLFLFFCVISVNAIPVQSQKIMVSGPSKYLVQTVKQIQQEGGNIIDVAIAGALSLSVTHPYFVSLGCGGFVLLKNKSHIEALDFREVAPHGINKDFYVKTKLSSRKGGAAVGVPGFVAGLWELHKKYGSLPWKKLIEPSIKLAQKGFVVFGEWSDLAKKSKDKFNNTGQKVFFSSKVKPYLPGQTLKQGQLAKALKLIKKKGRKAVYHRGSIAKDIVNTVKKHQGVMSLEDLENYKVRWLKPIVFNVADYTIYSMPLPSSGGIVLARAFQLLQQKKLKEQALYSMNEWHLMGEVLSAAFRPRNQMGDLKESSSYMKSWLSPQKLFRLGNQISLRKVQKFPALKNEQSIKESKETTHFSVINNKGQAVSMTLTLNGNWGSHVVTSKYGIVLNNQMDDFNTHPGKPNQFGLIQGTNNSVKPGLRPLSSMSPSIVEKNGKVVMALGASGGPMIISSVFQVLYRFLIQNLDLDVAVQAPRVHHQFLPRVLFVEKDRFSPIVLKHLKKRGHSIKIRKSIGKVYAVAIKDLLEGAFDSRAEGASGGL